MAPELVVVEAEETQRLHREAVQADPPGPAAPRRSAGGGRRQHPDLDLGAVSLAVQQPEVATEERRQEDHHAPAVDRRPPLGPP